jgi:predicted MFS family arabinose efflux permease
MTTESASAPSPALAASRPYAWLVFALTFALLLSDYMSRQVLNAVFPLLKAEWRLTDTALGSLSGVVAIMVGLLTFPLSLAADRIGRVSSVTLMALLWSVATLACGFAQNYPQMLGARLLVGVGEAAYGSVGLAILFSLFPANMRSTMTSAFMAGGVFGSVAGVALGGAIAAQYGWRLSFGAIAAAGLALGALYPLVVRAPRPIPPQNAKRDNLFRSVFPTARVTITYLASGLQLFIVSALTAWMPSFFNRAYAMAPGKSASMAGALILVGGAGMIVCGLIADRATRNAPQRKLTIAALYCALTFAALTAAFLAPTGPVQLALIAAGMFFSAGSTGPSGAIVANDTDPALHATVLATLTLANNLIGLAPGPVITGAIADHSSLAFALRIVPVFALAACATFLVARNADSHKSSHGMASP